MNATPATNRQRGLPAAAVSETVQRDPQFRMPERPRLCRGLHIVDTPSGVLVDGAAERQHLRGDSAKAIRARLFPLLDGSRDLAALARETGWSAAACGKAVATLYFAGLLEDAAAEVETPPSPRPSRQAAIWMSRTLDCSRVFPHSSHMVRAAARAVVRLAVREAWRRPLHQALTDLAVADVAPFDQRDCPADALVVLDLAAPRDLVQDVLGVCTPDGPRVLLAGVDGRRIAVGPLVDPSATACARCALAAVQPQPDPGAWAAGTAPTPRDAVACGLLAEEVRALVLRNEPAASLGGRLVVDLQAATTTTRKLTPEADCTTCYPTSAGEQRAGTTPEGISPGPLHYEYAVGFPPRHLVNPKAHQHHFRPENIGLQFERLRYPNNPRTPLPDVTLEDLRSLAEEGKPPAWPDALAAVLRYTVGLRTAPDQLDGTPPGRVSRWSPTGGNLGSPHAYPVLRGCPGLPDGIHYYDAADHTLTAMHPHTDHLAAVLASTGSGGRPGQPHGLHLVFTAELGRVARKYGPFSYRVGNLDTGCALAQLAVVARQARLALRLLDPAAWQPYRERLVGTSGPPLITAVVHITSEGDTPCR